jgi:hypothetical protein
VSFGGSLFGPVLRLRCTGPFFWGVGMVQRSRGYRTGRNFTVRISEKEFESLRSAGWGSAGPIALGPWLLWSACRRSDAVGSRVKAALECGVGPGDGCGGVGATCGQCRSGRSASKIVLDLCGGTGAWSRPYVDAGYDVRLVTLPDFDVRRLRLGDLALPGPVHGVLAAPPCTAFSIAKVSGVRDFAEGLETVVACLRLIAEACPAWWALENPGSGLLRRWMGAPTEVFQPHDFGDQHSKLTALWGVFASPLRRHCPRRRRMVGHSAAARAVTPAGFAVAFFRANP